MSEIQPFVPADIPGVADLFMRVFRKDAGPAPDSLKAYLCELYCNNPWNDGSFNSFVSRKPDGRISGFIGSMPRVMLFGNREINVVVAGNHMVDQNDREPFVGSNLLRRLLAGPQDLTITDSANDISRRLWERLGAATLLNYSLRWIRILRPAGYPLSFLPPAGRILRTVLAPLALAGDSVGRLFFPPPESRAAERLASRELSPDLMVSALAAMTGKHPLRPLYDIKRLEWLLSMARAKEQFGELKGRAIYDQGTLIGWYLYYARAGDAAQVLQLAALPEAAAGVMNHLFSHALKDGCAAVMGTVDPWLVREYHTQRCFILLRDMYTTAHAGDPVLRESLLSGRAYFSRLDGEWWTRLQGDRFGR